MQSAGGDHDGAGAVVHAEHRLRLGTVVVAHLHHRLGLHLAQRLHAAHAHAVHVDHDGAVAAQAAGAAHAQPAGVQALDQVPRGEVVARADLLLRDDAAAAVRAARRRLGDGHGELRAALGARGHRRERAAGREQGEESEGVSHGGPCGKEGGYAGLPSRSHRPRDAVKYGETNCIYPDIAPTRSVPSSDAAGPLGADARQMARVVAQSGETQVGIPAHVPRVA